MSLSTWSRRRLWEPIRAQLRQGLSPRGLAWSLCMALACSVFPVIGATTLLCLGVGAVLRLNHPVMQVVNYLAYPLQIALLLPFWRMGEWLFNAPRMDLNPPRIFATLQSDFWGAVRFYGAEAWHGTVAWSVVALPVACLAAFVLTPLFKRIAPRWKDSPEVSDAQVTP